MFRQDLPAHAAAFTELLTHEFFRKTGFCPEPVPIIGNLTPDFKLAKAKNEWLVDCALFTGRPIGAYAEDRDISKIHALFKQVGFPEYSFFIEYLSTPQRPLPQAQPHPPRRLPKFSEVRRHCGQLVEGYEKERREWDWCDHEDHLYRKSFVYGAWIIDSYVKRYNSQPRLGQDVIQSFGGPHTVWTKLREPIEAKCKKYKNTGFPLIVVINVNQQYGRGRLVDVIDALYGTNQPYFELNRDNNLIKSDRRDNDGLWVKKGEFLKNYMAALLVFFDATSQRPLGSDYVFMIHPLWNDLLCPLTRELRTGVLTGTQLDISEGSNLTSILEVKS